MNGLRVRRGTGAASQAGVGDEFAVPVGHRTGGQAPRGCLGPLEGLVCHGRRHTAPDACWLAIAFTNLRAVVALGR